METQTIWKYSVIGICSVIASFGGCTATINYHDNQAIVAMVEKGADPIKAKCAIRPNSADHACVLATQK